MGTRSVTVRMPQELVDQLDGLAASLDRDRSYLMKEAVSAYVETQAWQVRHIKEGLRQANTGKFASPAKVRATFRRLTGK